MGVFAGPEIAESGLVLALDAANSNSYPTTGTTWTDLSGNGNNGTLTNGPTYSSANSGSIVFDGVNDAFNANFTCSKTYFSIDFWCFPTTRSNYNWGMQFNDGWDDFVLHTTSTGGVFVGTLLSGRITPWRNDVYLLNTWQNFTFTFDNGAAKFYKNGQLETSKTLGISSRSAYTTYHAETGSCAGRISNFKIYSEKALTAAEVSQNFNALRGRFGI